MKFYVGGRREAPLAVLLVGSFPILSRFSPSLLSPRLCIVHTCTTYSIATTFLASVTSDTESHA